MRRIKYLFYKALSVLFGHSWMIRYYKSTGISIGNNTHIFSEIKTSEPYLISIGSNCTIATNVSLLTHDASVGALLGRSQKSDLCGRITIGNNCFIGDRSIILYGVHLMDNTIVAAGSVVTRSFNEKGIIVGGMPAKKIGTVAEFLEKYDNNFYSLHGLNDTERKNAIMNHEEKLIKR